MTAAYATGRIAWGICDRCGQRHLLNTLTDQVIDQKKSGIMVCGACLDIDHPQLRLGRTPIYDPQALKNPRPDNRADVQTEPQLTGYTHTGAPIFS